MSTCDLWIEAGRISIRPKSRFAHWYNFEQIDYRWPTVVLQRSVAPLGGIGLLVDIDGRLGAAWVERRRSVAANLDAYGFNVIHSPGRTWAPRWTPRPGKPLPVPRDVLGSHIAEVPPSFVAPSSD